MTQDLSIVQLMLNASWVVQAVVLLLILHPPLVTWLPNAVLTGVR